MFHSFIHSLAYSLPPASIGRVWWPFGDMAQAQYKTTKHIKDAQENTIQDMIWTTKAHQYTWSLNLTLAYLLSLWLFAKTQFHHL